MELSDREYLERLFEAFYEVGALPGGGVTRLGYTALEDEMHRRFGALAEALGGTVETDLAGNSYAFLAPAEEYVLIGSHLDSVIQGGPVRRRGRGHGGAPAVEAGQGNGAEAAH